MDDPITLWLWIAAILAGIMLLRWAWDRDPNRRWWRRYNRYLNSYSWERTRRGALRRDGYHCRSCGRGKSRYNALQAHHVRYDSYNRSGRTAVSDVVVLCQRCHERGHKRGKFRIRSRWAWLIERVVAFGVIS